jgi:hypothetical protein
LKNNFIAGPIFFYSEEAPMRLSTGPLCFGRERAGDCIPEGSNCLRPVGTGSLISTKTSLPPHATAAAVRSVRCPPLRGGSMDLPSSRCRSCTQACSDQTWTRSPVCSRKVGSRRTCSSSPQDTASCGMSRTPPLGPGDAKEQGWLPEAEEGSPAAMAALVAVPPLPVAVPVAGAPEPEAGRPPVEPARAREPALQPQIPVPRVRTRALRERERVPLPHLQRQPKLTEQAAWPLRSRPPAAVASAGPTFCR